MEPRRRLCARISAAAPALVRQVITLGSPFANEPKASNAWRLYEALSGRPVDDWPGREAMKLPPPVPSTAIYTRTDGIVAWQGCLEQESAMTQNIEVEGSHSGLGHNPVVLYAIAGPARVTGRQVVALRSQRHPELAVSRSAASRRRWCGRALSRSI